MATKVTFNNQVDPNPFDGMNATLRLLLNASGQISVQMIEDAYAEATDNKKRALFYSVCIAIGDITGRQHNIFANRKKDNGGNSNRQGFKLVLDWMARNDRNQFRKFVMEGIISEYTCMDFLFQSRIQTAKTKSKNPTIVSNVCMFKEEWYKNTLLDFTEQIIRGTNPFMKSCVAKFLTLPRIGKRQGHTKMLPETKANMEAKAEFLKELSLRMGWEYSYENHRPNFKGYRSWRKEYNGDLESVLFSTGKIAEFDELQFKEWLNKLPSGARFRVKNKVSFSKKEDGSPKWGDLAKWYAEWEQYKEQKQAEVRDIQARMSEGVATEEDKEALKAAKKEAKVTVGATNFPMLYQEICGGRPDKLKLEEFIQNKVNLPYNTVVFIDKSGSMYGAPYEFAAFIAAVCLYKNPDPVVKNLIGLFGSDAELYTSIDARQRKTKNAIMLRGAAEAVSAQLVNERKSFYDNYKAISEFLNAHGPDGCTYIHEIAEFLVKQMENNPEVVDALKAYPVWTIVSDGEWNNRSNSADSILEMQKIAEEKLGFTPYIIAIGINAREECPEYLAKVPNLMYIGPNPAQIEMFLTHFKDMQTFDSYVPLRSIFYSNRYAPVRANVI